jgi:hypothetical protein
VTRTAANGKKLSRGAQELKVGMYQRDEKGRFKLVARKTSRRSI